MPFGAFLAKGLTKIGAKAGEWSDTLVARAARSGVAPTVTAATSGVKTGLGGVRDSLVKGLAHTEGWAMNGGMAAGAFFRDAGLGAAKAGMWYGAGAGMSAMADTRAFDENPLGKGIMQFGALATKFTAARHLVRGVGSGGIRAAGALKGRDYGSWNKVMVPSKFGIGWGTKQWQSTGTRRLGDTRMYRNAHRNWMKHTGGFFEGGSSLNRGMMWAAKGAAQIPGRIAMGTPFAAGHALGVGYDALAVPGRMIANVARGAQRKPMVNIFGSRRLFDALEPGMIPRWSRPGSRSHRFFGGIQRAGQKIGLVEKSGSAPIASGIVGLGITAGLMKSKSPYQPTSGPSAMFGRRGSPATNFSGPALTLAIHNNRRRVL